MLPSSSKKISESSHHFHTQNDAIEYNHASVENAHKAVALTGGGSKGGNNVTGSLYHESLLLSDFLQKSGLLLHQLLQGLR